MPCYTPIYGSDNSAENSDPNSRAVRLFNHRADALEAGGQYLELACGKCGACRRRAARDWALRFYGETIITQYGPEGAVERMPRGAFLTLTYNDEHLPENGSLSKADLRDFMKRLRHHCGSVRYLACGEYGDTTQRPHYHLALVGHDFHADREIFYTNAQKICWISEKLAEIWGKGFCTLGPLNFATASYVAGYVFKKLRDERPNERIYGADYTPLNNYEISGRIPEFNVMSRRPGIGTKFIQEFWTDIYPDDVMHVNGKTFRPPRFFDTWLQKEKPKVWAEVQEKREEFIASQNPTTAFDLEVREILELEKAGRRSERFL